MDDRHHHFGSEHTSESGVDEHGSHLAQYVLYTSATCVILSHSKQLHWRILPPGKTLRRLWRKLYLTSITNIDQAARGDPPGLRVIPFGELNLLRNVGHDGELGVACRQRGRPSVKRLYAVRIAGHQSVMTAAVYQGDGAQEVHFGVLRDD
ncbi:hypothetical protein MVEN_00668700 [Mycena venus]|uniref:Uncharacterized protein n=1 Tax=Mycena venus TaxID=2733690 RepID=A0A8H7D8A8_9AGAR|nr:hypothetical protein MVEN_00668700 [Mycena venus]